jgi:hypothetical protein
MRRRAMTAVLVMGLGWPGLTRAADLVAPTWIRNDVGAAQAEARKTGKPIFVTFRCEA